jgi:DNA-directed RNA polymerase subunit RPC12/RpoP
MLRMIDFLCSECGKEHEQLLSYEEDPTACPCGASPIFLTKIDKYPSIQVGLAAIDRPQDLFEGTGLDHLAEGDGKNPYSYESTKVQVDLGG